MVKISIQNFDFYLFFKAATINQWSLRFSKFLQLPNSKVFYGFPKPMYQVHFMCILTINYILFNFFLYIDQKGFKGINLFWSWWGSNWDENGWVQGAAHPVQIFYLKNKFFVFNSKFQIGWIKEWRLVLHPNIIGFGCSWIQMWNIEKRNLSVWILKLQSFCSNKCLTFVVVRTILVANVWENFVL